MEKVLVTGGMGFIGNYLVSHLLSLGIEVLVLDKSINKPTYFPISGAKIIEGDVLSHELMHECLEQVDTCFHLAALSSVPACAKDWIFSHENNVLAFNGLMNELRKVEHHVKLVYASSAAVYGQSKSACLSESEHVDPTSTYGADKLSNEIYASVLAKVYGINSIGLRLFNVYGPGQLASNPYSGVINSFKNAILAEEPVKIFGDGKQTRDFIYVTDVVNAFMSAAATPYSQVGVFNVCCGNAISILDLAHLMMNLLDRQVPIIYEPARPGDVYRSLGDKRLAEQVLQFNATISMETGLNLFLKEMRSI
ncbi:MAG: NAD-dependent epimerase/dehydratase family protein [Legionella sp.]|jgi:UDP-glucose 4-epimerase